MGGRRPEKNEIPLERSNASGRGAPKVVARRRRGSVGIYIRGEGRLVR